MGQLIPTIMAAAATLTMSQVVIADYVGLSLEFEDQGNGLYTMHVFADFTASTDQLNAVFGDAQSTLNISASNGFYQNPFGGATSASINPALIPLFPSLAYDSWVTIGSEDNVDNAMLDIGIDWSVFESGGNIDTDNGTWFATPDDSQVLAGDDLRVLIGQFTTYGFDSHITGVINLQGKVGEFETFVARDQYFGWIPAPSSIVFLAISGLFQRRRRSSTL
ncbi:MAG TPA: hypothetical protein EYN32_02040 [Phycisphaerales bacterium]|nr:hypothetical protein [Phycisphaerales bacterium]